MEKKTKNDIAPPAKPNVMTNPVKKGSYGYTTKNYIGRGSEFAYMIDPYDRPREMEIEERKKFKVWGRPSDPCDVQSTSTSQAKLWL